MYVCLYAITNQRNGLKQAKKKNQKSACLDKNEIFLFTGIIKKFFH